MLVLRIIADGSCRYGTTYCGSVYDNNIHKIGYRIQRYRSSRSLMDGFTNVGCVRISQYAVQNISILYFSVQFRAISLRHMV